MHLVAGYCRCKPVLCVPAKGCFGEGLFRSAHIQFCDLAVIHAVTLLFPFFVKAFHSDTPKTDPIHYISQKVFEKYRAVLLKNIGAVLSNGTAVHPHCRDSRVSVRFAASSRGREISALNCSAFRMNYIKCGFVCQLTACRGRCCFRHFYCAQ